MLNSSHENILGLPPTMRPGYSTNFGHFFETHILVGWMRCGTSAFPPVGTQPRDPTLNLQPTTLTVILWHFGRLQTRIRFFFFCLANLKVTTGFRSCFSLRIPCIYHARSTETNVSYWAQYLPTDSILYLLTQCARSVNARPFLTKMGQFLESLKSNNNATKEDRKIFLILKKLQIA